MKSIILIASFSVLLSPSFVAAQGTLTSPTSDANPNSTSFKIVVCDGPAALNSAAAHQVANPDTTVGGTIPDPNWRGPDPNFVACDFNGAIRQIQHLIDIAMVFGVFAAVILFTFAGYLYITGKPSNIERAHSIFPKVFWGFIIMLTAWFVVFQLLSWLTNNPGFAKLLGSP